MRTWLQKITNSKKMYLIGSGGNINKVFKLSRKPANEALSLEYIVPENTQVLVDCLTHLAKLGKIECNFSYGESMKYNLPQWKSGEDMIAYIQTKEFTDTSYGDVYIRFV